MRITFEKLEPDSSDYIVKLPGLPSMSRMDLYEFDRILSDEADEAAHKENAARKKDERVEFLYAQKTRNGPIP